MQTYETQLLTSGQASRIKVFHENNIGTDYEVNLQKTDLGGHLVSISFFELEGNEVEALREFEKSLVETAA